MSASVSATPNSKRSKPPYIRNGPPANSFSGGPYCILLQGQNPEITPSAVIVNPPEQRQTAPRRSLAVTVVDQQSNAKLFSDRRFPFRHSDLFPRNCKIINSPVSFPADGERNVIRNISGFQNIFLKGQIAPCARTFRSKSKSQ